jgi:hypothetical protein
MHELTAEFDEVGQLDITTPIYTLSLPTNILQSVKFARVTSGEKNRWKTTGRIDGSSSPIGGTHLGTRHPPIGSGRPLLPERLDDHPLFLFICPF